VIQLEQVLESFLLVTWLVLAEVTLLRTAVAGLFCGKWWWFHPITPSRVDGSEPGASSNEAQFRARRLQFLIAVVLGWIPGLVIRGVIGPADPRVTGAVLAAASAGAILYLFRSLRRFDREGRERYVARTIAEGQERLDSIP
jgi:hypothetical protein